MGSCQARHCERNVDARLFHFYLSSEKQRFSDVWTCHVFPTFFYVCLKQCFGPKMPQKCPGGLWDHPRPIRDHFRPMLTNNRLTNYIRKIPIKIPIQIPIKNTITILYKVGLKGSWAQGFICLGAILWLLLKHSVIGFCFILGLKGSFVWVLFFGYYSTIQLSVLFFYRLGSRVTYLPLQVYIFVVSGSYNSRPDSRRHATSGCHTQGS